MVRITCIIIHYNREYRFVAYRQQEYIIEREGEYPTPVYPSVVSLDRGHDLYNVIHTYHSGPRGGGF